MEPFKSNVEVTYEARGYNISQLEGRLLTVVDAAIGDPEQRKALKDIVRQTVWNWAEFEVMHGEALMGAANVGSKFPANGSGVM